MWVFSVFWFNGVDPDLMVIYLRSVCELLLLYRVSYSVLHLALFCMDCKCSILLSWNALTCGTAHDRGKHPSKLFYKQQHSLTQQDRRWSTMLYLSLSEDVEDIYRLSLPVMSLWMWIWVSSPWGRPSSLDPGSKAAGTNRKAEIYCLA